MTNTFSIIALVVFPFLIMAAISRAFIRALRRHDLTGSLVLGYTLLHETALVCLPVYYSIFTGFSFEHEMLTQVGPPELAKVLLGELFFVVTFLWAFKWRGKPSLQHVREAKSGVSRPDCLFLGIVTALGIAAYLVALNQPFAVVSEAIQHAEIRNYSSGFELAEAWVFTIVLIPAIFTATTLCVARSVPFVLRMLGLTLHVCLLLYGVLNGLRGRLTWSLLALLGFAMMYGSRRVLVTTSALLVAAISLFSLIGDGNYRWYMMVNLGGQSQLAALDYAADSLQDGASKDARASLLDSMASRAMGPRNSAVLYEEWDNARGAGLAAIVSALVYPVPRLLWAAKAPAGSIDSTPYGAAMFKVMSIGHGAPYYVMGPYLASAHAYWEGGIVGLLISGFATGGLWALFVALSRKVTLPLATTFLMTFASSLLIDGLYTAFVPLFSIIRSGYWIILMLGVAGFTQVICPKLKAKRVIDRRRVLATA